MIRPSLPAAALSIAISLAAGSPSQAQNWITCAGEGQSCDLDGVGILRYGADDRWLYRVGTDIHGCSNGEFGGDPAPGIQKTCQRWDLPDEANRNRMITSLQAQLQQAQQEVAALQEQQEYVADLEAEVAALRRQLRRILPRRWNRDDQLNR